MDFLGRDPPKLKSFTSFFFFGKKEIKQEKPPMHLHTSASFHLEPGLKTLTSPLNPNRSITCFKTTLLSSSSFPSSILSSSMSNHEKERHEKEENSPHLIGLAEEEEDNESTNTHKTHDRIYPHQLSHRRRRSRSREKREFPPPIPLLARTGNLPCHMPWVLRRIRNNGRLVIQEVMVKHHEFFRTHRADGRLTLQLMHLNESVLFNRPPPFHIKPENEKKHPTPDDEKEEQEKETQEEEEEEEEEDQVVSIPTPNVTQENNNPSSSHSPSEEKIIQENNPSSAPLNQSLSPPTMSGGHLKTPGAANLDNDPLPQQEKSSPREKKNMPDVSQVGSLQCILSSSLPESSFGIGGNGGSCFASRGSNTLFQMPTPTIRPIHG